LPVAAYNFQKDFENKTKTGIISSLPIIIRRLSTILLKAGIPEKFPSGPVAPSPGPIPAMLEATAEDADTTSTPVATTITEPIMKIKRYSTMKESIEIFAFSLMVFPFSLIVVTIFG
jgi:hypothetical protein